MKNGGSKLLCYNINLEPSTFTIILEFWYSGKGYKMILENPGSNPIQRTFNDGLKILVFKSPFTHEKKVRSLESHVRI